MAHNKTGNGKNPSAGTASSNDSEQSNQRLKDCFIIDEQGNEIPMTEEMVQKSLDELSQDNASNSK